MLKPQKSLELKTEVRLSYRRSARVSIGLKRESNVRPRMGCSNRSGEMRRFKHDLWIDFEARLKEKGEAFARVS